MLLVMGQVREHPGGKTLPHDGYIHVVSEEESPVERVYIKTKDGLYVAAALRKPRGDGPFPVLIQFHGMPGGRGMEKLVSWSRGDTGGPVWERFLREGFVVVVADYRANLTPPSKAGNAATYADDGVAVVDYVKTLPFVDQEKINVYGVSLGGDLVLHLISRTKVHAAVLGAPAPFNFLNASRPGVKSTTPTTLPRIDEENVRKAVESIATPILIQVGTADALLPLDRVLFGRLTQAKKPVRLEIYANGYHDFVLGPQGHEGRAEPLLDATLDALDESLTFVKEPTAR